MNSTHVLHLTSAERSLFDALSPSLREGWTVKAETLSYTDTPKARELRFAISRFHDPKLLSVRQQFKNVKTDAEYLKLMESIDLGALSGTDLGQIMFALGPDALDAILKHTLTTASDDADLVMAGNFSELRHELLESLTLLS